MKNNKNTDHLRKNLRETYDLTKKTTAFDRVITELLNNWSGSIIHGLGKNLELGTKQT